MSYSDVLERLYNLKRSKQGDHERPHKPVLLLALLDIVEAGVAEDNRFPVDDRLLTTWRRYFDLVRSANDRPTPENPIYYLTTDGVWRLVANAGIWDLEDKGAKPKSLTIPWLKQHFRYGQLDEDLFAVASSPMHLGQLRSAIIGRYFPDHRTMLLKLSIHIVANLSNGARVPEDGDQDQDADPARDGAFRKLVLQLYDHRCTACGLRVKVDDIVIVDAAHLVPWSESHNDHPSNGIALCKNHHWAMDRLILAPGVDRKWHVSSRLDRRVADHQALFNLEGQSVFEPREKKFRPTDSFLKWREQRLLA